MRSFNISVFCSHSKFEQYSLKMELPSGSQKAPKSEAELSQAITGDPNAEYVTISHLSDDIVQLVRGSGGQVSYIFFHILLVLLI